MHSSEALSFLQHQIDHIAVPVFVADESDDLRFRFVAVNSLYARLWRLPKEQLIGREPIELCADPLLARTIIGKYRLCLAGSEPVSFQDRVANGESTVLVDTTLHKITIKQTGGHRIVGTAVKVDTQQILSGDIGFYVSLARNSMTTIEMLMRAGQERTSLTVSEREATEILTLDDVERLADSHSQKENSRETGMAGAVRRVLLH